VARRDALIVGDALGDRIAAGLSSNLHVHRRNPEIWTDHTLDDLGCDGLDLVVHCAYPAQSCRYQRLTTLSDDDWATMSDRQLENAVRLARAAHPLLKARHGTIVFVVPLMASAGGDGFAALATAAEGIRILAKSLAKSWGDDAITAHAVTLDAGAFVESAPANTLAKSNALHDSPLGRVPDDRDDVAPIIEWLAGPAAAPLTGTSLVVDGGLWMPG